MCATIETEAQYRRAVHRAVALQSHIEALRAVQALASANRYIGCIEPEDMRDLDAVGDALSDIGYTLCSLGSAIADWETIASYGTLDDRAAARAWHNRRLL